LKKQWCNLSLRATQWRGNPALCLCDATELQKQSSGVVCLCDATKLQKQSMFLIYWIATAYGFAMTLGCRAALARTLGCRVALLLATTE
jgi:hypothetical protein